MLSLDEQNAWRERYRQRRPEWRPATEVYAALVRGELQPERQPERQPSTLLLDLGCGRGGLVEQLDHPLCHMVGVDPDWLSLHEHRLPLPRVVAQSERLPFRQDSFDLVFASWVLEHLADPAAVLTAVSRILRPGGAFVFITPNGRHPLAAFNRVLGRVGRWQGRLVNWLYGRAADDTFPTFYRINTPARINELCQQSDLIMEALYLIPDPTYLAFNPSMFKLTCLLEERLPDSCKLHLIGLARHP